MLKILTAVGVYAGAAASPFVLLFLVVTIEHWLIRRRAKNFLREPETLDFLGKGWPS